jgi:hypothetical protein
VPARQPPTGSSVYVAAALIALVPLIVLSAAAPGGNDWRFLELPRNSTLIAAVLCIAITAQGRLGATAFAVPVITLAGTIAWDLVVQRGYSAEGIIEEDLTRLSPWLVGSLYGLLAFLAVRRSATPILNRRRAGAWLLLVAAIAVGFTLANRSWLTLQNLSERGTFRSSVPWPDTKKLAIVTAAITAVFGLAFVARSRRGSTLPRAVVRR